MRITPRGCLHLFGHARQSQTVSAREKSVSFIGLGRMGYEMAFNLFSKTFADSQSHDAQFVVCDAIPQSARTFCDSFLSQFPDANIRVVGTAEEAVLASQTIVTMLPSSPQVRAVYLEAGGIIPTLKDMPVTDAQSTLCIDSTTLDVEVARGVAKDVTQAGAQIVDAPVSGGVAGAKAATLSFLVGGTPTACELANPVLSRMGKRIIYCGPSGAGLGAKICNNLVLGVQQIVVAEAMLLGHKLGLDAAVLAGVINSSTGSCWSSSVNNPVPSALPGQSPPCERDYEGGFATMLMLKDMGLATGIADEFGVPLPLGEAAEGIYADVLTQQPALARKDFSSVYQYLRDAAQEDKKVPMGAVTSS